MARFEFYQADTSTGFMRLLSLPFYFGATWLPLLMLVPYAILLHPTWRDSLSPIAFKAPLFIGCVIGWLIFMAHNIIAKLRITFPQKELDLSQVIVANTLNNINMGAAFKDFLEFSINDDKRIRQAALIKIKEPLIGKVN